MHTLSLHDALPIYLKDFVNFIEKSLNKKAKIELKPIQKGDVKDTVADNSLLFKEIDYKPKTSFKEGVQQFINWYKEYYNKF